MKISTLWKATHVKIQFNILTPALLKVTYIYYCLVIVVMWLKIKGHEFDPWMQEQKDVSIWNINIVLGWGKWMGENQPFCGFGFTVGKTKMISDAYNWFWHGWMMSIAIDFASSINSNLKLKFVDFDSTCGLYTQIYC